MIEPLGGFALVHVATPIEECENRDRKGLYAKARAGILKQFTGISDPYEVPTDAALTIQTTDSTPDAAAETIIDYLRAEGYLPSGRQE
jgi:sulfate adenylyltransferase